MSTRRKKHPRDVLKLRRLDTGISITEFASMLGVDTATWSRIEAGVIATINPHLYEAACAVLAFYEKGEE